MGSGVRTLRIGAVSTGLALTLGATAAPAKAHAQRSTATTPAQTTAAPAPTGLAYTYDAAGQTVTVTWNPQDPADTLTRNYRPGLCGPTPETPASSPPRSSWAPPTPSRRPPAPHRPTSRSTPRPPPTPSPARRPLTGHRPTRSPAHGMSRRPPVLVDRGSSPRGPNRM
ncbi:hypothetical protein LT493_15815 [Streptomyces tricolor]|nr:hypothetical protein [Streptomyces tricolor]